MAIKTNFDVAHRFFYQDGHERFRPSWLNCGFDGGEFYSYSTIVAKIVTGLDGQHYTLVSYDKMSPTTGRHISNVESASPYEVIKVPMEYGSSYFDTKTIEPRLIERLERISSEKMSRKENRQEYIDYYNMLLECNDYVVKISNETLTKYRPLYDALQSSDGVKALKKNIAEIERKERKRLMDIYKSYFDMYSISQVARIVYDPVYANHCDVSLTVRDALRKIINPKKQYAFVWRVEDGSYRTSKSVRMSKEIANAALKRFIAKELRHGDTLGYYTILAITDKSVKIGCHNIPIENVHDLYETMED